MSIPAWLCIYSSASLCFLQENLQDGDDASCLVLDRKTYAYSNVGIDLHEIANDQGYGEYESSIWVKAEKKNQTMKLKAAAQIEYQNDNPRVLDKTTLGKVVEVTNEWTQLKCEFKLQMSERPTETHLFIYIIQDDASQNNLYNLIVDNARLIKKGSYVEVTPEPDIEIPAVKKITELERSSKIEIGAIYYNTW